MIDNHSLVQSIADLESQQCLEIVQARIANGDNLQLIIEDSRKGMEEVGRRFETGEYFIADLIFSANIFEKIMDIFGAEVQKGVNGEKAGKILVATVQNDIHDIGKNLVISMLNAEGFEIIDLGVNVPPETVCKSVEEHKPDIVALSCLLTTSLDSVEKTIIEIQRAGFRDKVKIIVGGIPLTADLAMKMNADAYGDDARRAVVRCKELLGEAIADE